jgi:hypothetical protein
MRHFRWNPADHPRWPNGKFRPKLSQSVRASPHSVSYNIGYRVPAGKVNIYAGALLRVERANRTNIIRNATSRIIDRALGEHAGGRLGTLLKDREVKLNDSISLQAPSRILNTPSFRLQKSTGGQRRRAPIAGAPIHNAKASGSARTTKSGRAINRKPRSRKKALTGTKVG